ncbi:MAG TPA: aminoglycoside 6'-N-acetyltransferase [Candidatus Binatia bacterium]
MLECKPVRKTDFAIWLAMGRKLWPKEQNLRRDFARIAKLPYERVFICWADEAPAGFVEVSMRRDYVEGSSSSPTGYLEGIFVEKKFRKTGVARLLVRMAEAWAKKRGASEFGSDTRLANRRSRKFHKALGFSEVEKNVAFIKKL